MSAVTKQVQAYTEPPTEAANVRSWRIGCAERAGCPAAVAVQVADHVTEDGWPLDVHKLADMTRAGCPPLLAVEILR